MIKGRNGLAKARRIVIKVGSSLLADPRRGVRAELIRRLASEITALDAQKKQVVLVSSGAIALGRVILGLKGRSLSVHEKQAAAAVGQPRLMHAYSEAFGAFGRIVAQMLLTKDDLRHRRRYLNAKNTSQTLLECGIIPIVNENDTVVVEEIKFGDNDNLAALVALLVDADLMILLTDVDALYTKDPTRHPQAKRVSVLSHWSPEIMAMAQDTKSVFGTGGMASKLHAARIATRGGVPTLIASGHEENVLGRLLAGEDLGTLILCGVDRQSRRKHWIAEVLRPQGRIWVDDGAAKALVEKGSSLLPVGITRVEGTFDKGECVEIWGRTGLIGRGLCNYNAEETRRLVGVPSARIEEVLGYRDFSSIIHRDNLVILEGTKELKDECE